MKKFVIISLFIFILIFAKSQQIVSAQTKNTLPLPAVKRTAEVTKDNTTRVSALKENRADLRASAAAQRKQARTDRLDDAKIRACEARQSAIRKRSDGIVRRAKNQLNVFSKIVQRVQEFYQNKLVPQGKTVANYDSLVANIASSEAAVAPLLSAAQASAAGFSCDRDNPSGQVREFNEDMKAVISALGTYRKSVRALIVAVKGAAGSGNSATTSALPL
ncbi:MAG: hypothetical protein HYU48_00485 [Candidatus Levybacteria bacterium]|nr:hypothetical protein [Candidatus Levybacteria bacterium]